MKHIQKSYFLGKQEVPVIEDVSLEIKTGEFVSIIGPSGSGKSTLMNIIGCLDTADSGEYYLHDRLIYEYGESALAKVRNEEIGFVFQSFHLIGKLTAAENIELPLLYKGVKSGTRKALVEQALERVGLLRRAKHKPSELSGGQQQRVAIARALVTDPALILADEPTGNLDSQNGTEIMNLLHSLHEKGKSVVLITHDDKVAKQADRMIRIFDGKVEDMTL